MTVDERIAAFLGGDRQAGQALLLELLPRVRNVVRALLGRDADVDDISQQVMVDVIRGLGGYRGDSPLAGWVDRITVRVTLNHARKSRVQVVREGSWEEEQATTGGEMLEFRPASGERYVEKRAAVKALDSLPGVQKTALVLHHVLGFTVAEIAAQEQVPAETVRSRLRIGMTKLRSLSAEQRTPRGEESAG